MLNSHAGKGASSTSEAVREVAEAGIAAGLHSGVQVYASVGGDAVVDLAVGSAGPSPFTSETVVPWLSATKPLVAVCVGQLHADRALDLDDHVIRHLPSFRGGAREDVRIRHLLTHTVPFTRDITMRQASADPERAWRAACELPLQPHVRPGAEAGYSALAAWQILGEIVRRTSGATVDELVRTRIFEPAGMVNCHLAVADDRFDAVWERRCDLFDTSGGTPGQIPWVNQPSFWRATIPGMGGRGPIRELGRFYEALLGLGPTASLLDPEVIEMMVTTQRARQFDSFYQSRVDWGLGFVTDRRLLSGVRGSRRTFGHDGMRCSLAFADPEHGFVFCAMANGLASPAANVRRMRAIVDATMDAVGLGVAGRRST